MTTFAAQALAAARVMGQRVCTSALWSGDECTWQVVDSEALVRRQSQRFVVADAGLYRGTSGIALFLFELWKTTGDRHLIDTARGAMRYALRKNEMTSGSALGAAHGRVGIAYVLARAAVLTGEAEWKERAVHCIEPILGQEASDTAFDFMFGAAGTILGLLRVHTWLQWERALASAIDAGHRLMAAASPRATGLSWAPVGAHLYRQDLTGLSHGASGPGVALFSLYDATGSHEFRIGAALGLAYEDAQFNQELGNWPDHRIDDLRNLAMIAGDKEASADTINAAEQRLVALAAKPPQTRHSTFWCNGAPGIGIARALAYRSTGKSRYRELAVAAARTALDAIPRIPNYCLCHGVMGNIESALLISHLTIAPELAGVAHRVVARGIEEHGGSGTWPTGAEGGTPDASLFVGTAGIGLALLRMARPDIPSALVLGGEQALGSRRTSANSPSAAVHQCRARARAYFGVSLDVLELEEASTLDAADIRAVPNVCDLTILRRELRRIADRHPTSRFADAFVLEAAMFDAELGAQDWTMRHLLTVFRQRRAVTDLLATTVVKARDVRVLEQRFDWALWTGHSNSKTWPQERRRQLLVFCVRGQGRFLRLGRLSEAVLRALEQPATIRAAAECVAKGFATADRERIRRRAEALALSWYKHGVIDDARDN